MNIDTNHPVWWEGKIFKCPHCDCIMNLKREDKIKTNWLQGLMFGFGISDRQRYYYVKCNGCKAKVIIFDFAKVIEKAISKEGIKNITDAMGHVKVGYVNLIKGS